MVPLRGLSWKGTIFVSAVIVLGAMLVPIGIMLHPLTPGLVPTLLYLAVFTQIAALMPIKWRHGHQTLDGLPLIAAGLIAPGGGVSLIAWLFVYDGRRPSAEIPLWRLLYQRATLAFGYGGASLLIALLPLPESVDTLVRSILMGIASILIPFPLTAAAFSFMLGERFWGLLEANIGSATARSAFILAVGGGALAMLVRFPGGFLMGAGLLGLLVAVRSNMADAQRQEIERVQTLELLAQALDARDSLTEMHSQRVADLAARLGEVLELRPVEIERLRVAGLLHDIGKIGVRDSILKKPEKLDPAEWAEMRSHAARGADMIGRHSALAPLAPWVRYHHERMDGSGYPEGKVGGDIPQGARIIAVADSYDTITGARAYRLSTMTPREAVLDISNLSGTWYDPTVVNALRFLYKMPPLRLPDGSTDAEASDLATGVRLVLRRRRFGWLTSGMAVSSLGDPLTNVAIVITVYAITRNPFMVAATYALKGVATVATASFLGGVSDSWNRRNAILTTDISRAVTLALVPIAVHLSLFTIFAAVVILSAAEAIGQASREAAMPDLVRKGEVGAGNAVIGTAVMLASAIGYPLAAGVLWLSNSTTPLFLVDAGTFLVAAALTLAIGNVGGGVAGRRLTGAFKVAWGVTSVRWPLALAAAAAFFIAMTPPTLVVLAYRLSSQGARTYTILALLTTVGQVGGYFLLTRRRRLNPVRATLAGLALMAAFSLGVAISPWLALSGGVLLVASAGNSIYLIGNRSQLQEATASDRRGSVMITRFALTQTGLVAGSAVAGLLAGQYGPHAVFAVLGLGLSVLFGLAWRHYRAGVWQERQILPDTAIEPSIMAATRRRVGQYAKRG